MKKPLFLTGVMMMLAASALAGPPKEKAKDKKAAAKTEVHCAVKGDMVNIKKATEEKMFADYKGNRYFFCCGGCPDAFKKDPAKFAKADHIAIPKSGKAIKKS